MNDEREGTEWMPGDTVQVPSEKRPNKLQRLLSGGVDNRIELENAEHDPLGVALVFDVLDGDTKLRYDGRVNRAAQKRGDKEIIALQEALEWIFGLKLLSIEGLTAEDLEGVEPKAWFATDPNGIILMRTATNEYLRRNRVTIGESKN